MALSSAVAIGLEMKAQALAGKGYEKKDDWSALQKRWEDR